MHKKKIIRMQKKNKIKIFTNQTQPQKQLVCVRKKMAIMMSAHEKKSSYYALSTVLKMAFGTLSVA
jgi:hypothetical protein